MICQQLNALLGFDCSPLSESGDVALVSTPFKFDDGDAVPVFVEHVADQVRFFDDGQSLMHFIGRGIRIENKKQAQFLINTANRHGAEFTEQGEIEVWSPVAQAHQAFAKYINTLLSLVSWEREQRGSNSDMTLFVEEVAMALRARTPNAKIDLDQPIRGISGKVYKVDFLVDGQPIVATGVHANSIGSMLHKLIDIKGLHENKDADFTIVIDDRADPEGAKREALIMQTVGTVLPFTALESASTQASASSH